MARYIDASKYEDCRIVLHREDEGVAVKEIPTADVQEVRHGHWERCFEDWRRQIWGDECSACGFRHYGTYIGNYNYCPHCGSKMDGAEAEAKLKELEDKE